MAAEGFGLGSEGLGGPCLLVDGVAVAAGRRDGQVGGPLGYIVVAVWAAVVHGRRGLTPTICGGRKQSITSHPE